MRRDEIQALIATSRQPYYVYVLKRPGHIPFYVGKGRGLRVLHHEREAAGKGKSYKLNIIRAVRRAGLLIDYSIEAFFDDEFQAHRLEVELIARIGRHDLGKGPLTNLTDGGEGTSNPSDETRQRHLETLGGADAEGERGIANRFFRQLQLVRSVPIKPISEFKPIPLTPHPQPRQRTPRMAAALAASAIANRVMLENGCAIPRRMMLDGGTFVVENGVGRDILQAGLASLMPAIDPGEEQFRLDAEAVRYVAGVVGEAILLDAGVLMPAV